MKNGGCYLSQYVMTKGKSGRFKIYCFSSLGYKNIQHDSALLKFMMQMFWNQTGKLYFALNYPLNKTVVSVRYFHSLMICRLYGYHNKCHFLESMTYWAIEINEFKWFLHVLKWFLMKYFKWKIFKMKFWNGQEKLINADKMYGGQFSYFKAIRFRMYKVINIFYTLLN